MFNYKKIIGMEEKISIAEINRLMEEAEQERSEHRRVMRLVQQIKDEGWGAVSFTQCCRLMPIYTWSVFGTGS